MLAAPIMPTTPLLNPRRRACSALYDDDDMCTPKVKRPHLLCQGNHKEYGMSVNHKQNGLLPKSALSSYSRSKVRRTANMKAKVQLYDLLKEESSQGLSVVDGFKLGYNVCHAHTNGYAVSSQVYRVADKIPVINLKKNELKLSKLAIGEKTCATQYASSSDVDSDCSESSRMSIPKSKIKQPAIVLMKMNQPVKKKPPSPSPRPVSPHVSNVVVGGYVHRMAYLNARACVAAYLEPEKKFAPKSPYRGGHKKTAGVKATSLDSNTVNPTSSTQASEVNSNPVVLSNDVYEIGSEVSNRGGHKKTAGVKTTSLDSTTVNPTSSTQASEVNSNPAVLSNDVYEKAKEIGSEVSNTGSEAETEVEVSYNIEGLLYNGDTLHPDARVFRTDVPEFSFPARVIPTLVPARISSVKKAKCKACVTGIVHVDKKLNRKNNGWHPLGKPIKVLEYQQGCSRKCRTYYAGIRRRSEDIYVRDCVVIKSDIGNEEKPYVAKIGSIWQEPDGRLMITTFWYYRPDDVKIQNAAVECVGRELLASQHHDTNSVACIEDKCFVLGYSQYCRYHASVVKSTVINPFSGISSSSVVPQLAKKNDYDYVAVDDDDFNLVELDPKKQYQEPPDVEPSLSELENIDPFLVFLCYRGFNHISGRVHNGRY